MMQSKLVALVEIRSPTGSSLAPPEHRRSPHYIDDALTTICKMSNRGSMLVRVELGVFGLKNKDAGDG